MYSTIYQASVAGLAEYERHRRARLEIEDMRRWGVDRALCDDLSAAERIRHVDAQRAIKTAARIVCEKERRPKAVSYTPRVKYPKQWQMHNNRMQRTRDALYKGTLSLSEFEYKVELLQRHYKACCRALGQGLRLPPMPKDIRDA